MKRKRLTVVTALVLSLALVPAVGSAEPLFGNSATDPMSGALGSAIMGGILGAGIGAMVKHDGKRRIGEGAAIGAGLGLLLGSMMANQQAAAPRQYREPTYYYPSTYTPYQPTSFYPAQTVYSSTSPVFSTGSTSNSQALELELERQRALEAELERLYQRNEELRQEFAAQLN